jgi:hypothetical protein
VEQVVGDASPSGSGAHPAVNGTLPTERTRRFATREIIARISG